MTHNGKKKGNNVNIRHDPIFARSKMIIITPTKSEAQKTEDVRKTRKVTKEKECEGRQAKQSEQQPMFRSIVVAQGMCSGKVALRAAVHEAHAQRT